MPAAPWRSSCSLCARHGLCCSVLTAAPDTTCTAIGAANGAAPSAVYSFVAFMPSSFLLLPHSSSFLLPHSSSFLYVLASWHCRAELREKFKGDVGRVSMQLSRRSPTRTGTSIGQSAAAGRGEAEDGGGRPAASSSSRTSKKRNKKHD
eukprot:GHVU01035104.1.p1 GENE.GHVU01035104.1~~GHVU01035104.1.p1  ORF type:complete len:149 (+),score=18.36 GHVU01035104.1:864-1310(+)